MKLLLLFIIFSFASSVAQAEKNGFHICYFSLNNEKEFEQMEEFTNKLNKFSKFKITVSEHITEENNNPEEAFKAMIESGQQCDGLVITGHHTGAFGGARVSGHLNIDFLEKLSCEKKYQDWFTKINSLWLQGCRTLGVGKIETIDQDAEEYNADYHTNRVGAVLDEDALEQSFADLNMEFSATLDQDNPLSTRYLRLFPKAKVFGWTKTAPGKNAHSEYSIPYHIAHISKLLEKDEIENPLAETFTKQQAQEYLDSMQLLLNDWNKSASGCEDLAIEGWLQHGQKYGPTPYSLNNPDLQAYPKQSSSTDSFLLDLKRKECQLKNAKSKEEILSALDAITSSQAMIHFGFNSIWEKLQNNTDPQLQLDIQNHLKNKPEILQFIENKLQSKQLGLLRKIDYYAFYRDLTGNRSAKVEENIFQLGLTQLTLPIEQDNYAAIDYKSTLLQSLLKNSILNDDQIITILNSKNVDTKIINNFLSEFNDQKRYPKNSSLILSKVLDSNELTEDIFTEIILMLKSAPLKNEEIKPLFMKIFNHKQISNYKKFDLIDTAYELRNTNREFRELFIQNANDPKNIDIFLSRITENEFTNPEFLTYIIEQAKNNPTDKNKLLKWVKTNFRSDSVYLSNIGNNKISEKIDMDYIIDLIIKSGDSDLIINTPYKNLSLKSQLKFNNYLSNNKKENVAFRALNTVRNINTANFKDELVFWKSLNEEEKFIYFKYFTHRSDLSENLQAPEGNTAFLNFWNALLQQSPPINENSDNYFIMVNAVSIPNSKLCADCEKALFNSLNKCVINKIKNAPNISDEESNNDSEASNSDSAAQQCSINTDWGEYGQGQLFLSLGKNFNFSDTVKHQIIPDAIDKLPKSKSDNSSDKIQSQYLNLLLLSKSRDEKTLALYKKYAKSKNRFLAARANIGLKLYENKPDIKKYLAAEAKKAYEKYGANDIGDIYFSALKTFYLNSPEMDDLSMWREEGEFYSVRLGDMPDE